MSGIEVHCPHCSVRLRLRDVSYIGRTITCPDCAAPVTITRPEPGRLECVPAAAASFAGHHPAPLPSSAAQEPPVTPGAGQWSQSPRTIAWVLSGVLALGIVVVLLLPAPTRAPDSPQATDETTPVDASVAMETGPRPPAGDCDPSPELRKHLQALGNWTVEYRDKSGRFPKVPDAADEGSPQALGWMADLIAVREPHGPQPLWDRHYTDPLNSRFVRRRIDGFLNPAFADDPAQGFPASHFTGISGVGADAAELPAGHPRAGVFGSGRTTRPDAITDGMSNTLLIAGMNGNFAPWASNSPRLMQGLTSEPYINGPDGLGTGQPDRMLVLMADGSVRALSDKTSPVVMRRMATIADGLPLDPDVPGEPDTPVESPSPPRMAAENNPRLPAEPAAQSDPEDRPIDVLIAREPPPRPQYDVERALAQPIVRFTQIRPVQSRELLLQIEELAGIPIRTDEIAERPESSRLEQEVSLDVRETTVGDLLQRLLEEIGLSYETGRDFGIRLTVPAS